MSSDVYFEKDNYFFTYQITCNHTYTDLISIRNCSIWLLNIIWRFNKFSQNHIIFGKNESINNLNNNKIFSQNIQNALPIDFSLSQQFVYEKSLEKIKFSIKYDIIDSDCPIKYLNREYSNYNFEIFINVSRYFSLKKNILINNIINFKFFNTNYHFINNHQ